VLAVAGLAGTPSQGVPATDGGTAAGGGSGGGADALWAGSLTGPPTVLTAPAVNMIGARPGGYWRVQGTSFAAPLVAGAAALVRSRWPTLDAANVINRLIRTARDLGPRGRDDRYGYGEVNPVAALTTPLPVVRRNPLIAPKGRPGPVAEPPERALPARGSAADRVRQIQRVLVVVAAVNLTGIVLALVVGLVFVLRLTRRRTS
jgi:subtilisin family serine protease